ncbi:pyridoxal-phosphate-dependent aminotransferase family protein [Pseudoroseicyclus tamaricis]|uniref:Alanine--glyoxylate aminotransferase family protein n=1 Tax=Pseudoroseicyclus tamaricis TaxID=2705421 RepID=A0A6B2JJ10_9RHOB|nr:aminotransferase class V-fold PLP-dependent enzyme [Pseudoroseicyclus tamaricis]NDV01401.1 alanine--glyoxylate aminotransferase family protein [Pseudoroseicyclus tamaricis]
MLANGRTYLAIPGPSVMPERVLGAMHMAAPNIYEGELHDMVARLKPDLARVVGTAHNVAIYIGNGHAAWEASLANVIAPGDKVLVLATGRFGIGWGETAARLGAEVEHIRFPWGQPVDPAQVEAHLRAKGPYRAVLVCQVDTATSVKTDIAPIRAAIDAAGSEALLMVDCMASLGCDRFEMDASGADVVTAGCQKGLMTPPGLAFVFFGPRAEAAQRGDAASIYWDWRARAHPEIFFQHFGGTAPTHHLYGLRAALDMIFEEGLENVWRRHRVLSEAIWAALEAWDIGGALRPTVPERADRAWSVTTVEAGGDNGQRLRRFVEQQAGVTLGIGLGAEVPAGFFRIGHMGHVNAHMVLGVLGCIGAGLKALDIPHGQGGLDAAMDVIARA